MLHYVPCLGAACTVGEISFKRLDITAYLNNLTTKQTSKQNHGRRSRGRGDIRPPTSENSGEIG